MLDLFADDATLSSSNPSILNLTNCLNGDLIFIQDWCIRNNMVVYVPKIKSKFLASHTAANKILENRPDLKLSDKTINISTKEKLLGVHIDKALSWTAQAESIIKKTLSTTLTQQDQVLPTYTHKKTFI